MKALRWLWAEQLALPLLALVPALIELVAIRWVYLAAFGPTRRIAESSDRPLGHAVLWVFGGAAAALALLGTYRLLRYGRAWVAGVLVPLVCLPVLVVGLGSLYASVLLAALL